MIYSILAPFLFLLNFVSCDQAPNSQEPTSYTFLEGYEFPYTFREPDTAFALADDLLEVSGLTVVNDGANLACVQDEEGILYVLNKESGAIEQQIEFHSKGDFEGVELVGETIYIVKSKGDIYQVNDWQGESKEVKIHETHLNKMANVEGLGYDVSTNKLLLACKGKMEQDDSFTRSIYGFDLATNKLDEKPMIKIDLELLHSYLNSGEPIKYLEKINEKLDPKNGFSFGPSGIAIHPITKNIYVISSVGKMLMVLDPSGKIIHIEKFKKKHHPQPEGICFEKDGTLWVSSEANESKPYLKKYSMN